jgi:hypothetical protein
VMPERRSILGRAAEGPSRPVPHLSEPTTALPSRGRKHPGSRRCEA